MILNNEKTKPFVTHYVYLKERTPREAFTVFNLNFTVMTIEMIYDKFYSQVFNAVRTMVTNVHDAEEVTADVFVKVNRLLHTFDESKSAFTTWLYTITRSVILDFFKTNHQDRFKAVSDFMTKDGNDVFTFHTNERADDLVREKEMQAEIAKAFRSLKPKYRKVATLFFLREQSHAEIAEVMDIPLGSVKGMINRCRATLQEQLQSVYRMA